MTPSVKALQERAMLVPDTVNTLQAHLRKLSDEQMKVITDSIYLGMTKEVAKECEERRNMIAKLVDELAKLCK